MSDVKFSWSNDGLTLVMSTIISGSERTMKILWKDKEKIPTEEKLKEQFLGYLASYSEHVTEDTLSKNKILRIPFNKVLSLGFTHNTNYDTALLRLGVVDIKLPVDSNKKVSFATRPSFSKSDSFGFGIGTEKTAAWAVILDKNNQGA